MVRKKLKAILALLVAVMFVLQAAPMYSFAQESAKDAGTVTAGAAVSAGAGNC